MAMQPRAIRWRWGLMVPVTCLRGLMEGGAAAAVFALIKVILDPRQLTYGRVVSRTAAFLPWRNPHTQQIALICMVALYYLLKNLLVLGSEYLRNMIVGESAVSLKNTLTRGYIELPVSFHARSNSAKLLWNVNSAVDIICQDAMSAAVAIA